jgi:hypothetical protein
MKKTQTTVFVRTMTLAFICIGLFLPELIRAGEMEPSAAPGSTMRTLDEIYDASVPGGSLYVPCLHESTGSGIGATDAFVFLMNTTGAAIDVQVYIYTIDGTNLINGTGVTLPSGQTTPVGIEALMGTVPGDSVTVNVKITSADTNFSSANIAVFAGFSCILSDGVSYAAVPVLWKNE